jgi:ribosomal protein L15
LLKPLPATINVGELEDFAVKLLGAEAVKSGAELDLTEIGIGKLLGRGSISTALKVRVESISANAKSKLEEAGGSIIE